MDTMKTRSMDAKTLPPPADRPPLPHERHEEIVTAPEKLTPKQGVSPGESPTRPQWLSGMTPKEQLARQSTNGEENNASERRDMSSDTVQASLLLQALRNYECMNAAYVNGSTEVTHEEERRGLMTQEEIRRYGPAFAARMRDVLASEVEGREGRDGWWPCGGYGDLGRIKKKTPVMGSRRKMDIDFLCG